MKSLIGEGTAGFARGRVARCRNFKPLIATAVRGFFCAWARREPDDGCCARERAVRAPERLRPREQALEHAGGCRRWRTLARTTTPTPAPSPFPIRPGLAADSPQVGLEVGPGWPRTCPGLETDLGRMDLEPGPTSCWTRAYLVLG